MHNFNTRKVGFSDSEYVLEKPTFYKDRENALT